MAPVKAPPVPGKRAGSRRKATEDPQGTVPPVPPVPDPPGGPFPPDAEAAATDSPPVSPKAREARKAGRTPALQASLEELFATPALAYSFAGDEWAAELVTTRSKAFARDCYELAQKNPAVKRLLTRLVEGSAVGAVLMSGAAIFVPLAQHHGLIPGADPFALFYPPLPADRTAGPIVPPPPSAGSRSPAPAPAPPPGGGGGTAPPPPRGDVHSVPGAVVVGQNGAGVRAS